MSAENAWKVAREAGAAEADRMAWEWRNTPPPRDGFAPVYEAAARKVATSLRSLPMPPAIRAEEERAEITRLRADLAAAQEREQRMREALLSVSEVITLRNKSEAIAELPSIVRAALGEPQ